MAKSTPANRRSAASVAKPETPATDTAVAAQGADTITAIAGDDLEAGDLLVRNEDGTVSPAVEHPNAQDYANRAERDAAYVAEQAAEKPDTSERARQLTMGQKPPA